MDLLIKVLKQAAKIGLALLLIPVLYTIVALLFTNMTVDRKVKYKNYDQSIYLSSNGVHLDIILPIHNVSDSLFNGIKHYHDDQFVAFGWGDENFYIKTPSWSGLTFSNAFTAMFLESTSLMHVTRYKKKRSKWIKIDISKEELRNINKYIEGSFQLSAKGKKVILENQGYSTMDEFYKATGSYSCFKTCNSWVNKGFIESGLKACFWTPFDFGLIQKYAGQ